MTLLETERRAAAGIPAAETNSTTRSREMARPATTLRREMALGSGDAPDQPRAVSARTLDDLFALGGAAIASLALVWVVYERMLPWSGTLGFVVCWFVVFVAFFGSVTALSNPGPAVRDRFATTLITAGYVLGIAALFSAVGFTIWHGHDAWMHPGFLSHDESHAGPLTSLSIGGCLHAIVGTLIEIGIAVAITLPLGVGTAVFMSEVGGRGARTVRTIVEAMTALPSVVAGLFIYSVLLLELGFSKTGFSAAMALSVMMLPIIARASDVVLRVIPGGLREASLALGASKWQTVWRVVLPTARPGLATALILGIARGVGETSPVLLTSGASSYLNANPLKDPMNSLPLYVYTHVRSGQTLYIERGYGAASALIVLVLVLFVVTRVIARTRKGDR